MHWLLNHCILGMQDGSGAGCDSSAPGSLGIITDILSGSGAHQGPAAKCHVARQRAGPAPHVRVTCRDRSPTVHAPGGDSNAARGIFCGGCFGSNWLPQCTCGHTAGHRLRVRINYAKRIWRISCAAASISCSTLTSGSFTCHDSSTKRYKEPENQN